MKILALELSTARGSLAWLNDAVEFARKWPNDRKNSAPFFENLNIVTKRFGVPEIIIVGLGPGSYAGTRIAISVGSTSHWLPIDLCNRMRRGGILRDWRRAPKIVFLCPDLRA